jgi:hypothetical protein
MKQNFVSKFEMALAEVIFDRENRTKTDNYYFERNDKAHGFNLTIKKGNETIITVDYGKNGGVVSNLGATTDEINAVIKTLNSAFAKKSYVR